MVGEGGEGRKREGACGAGLRGVVVCGVFLVAEGCVSRESVVGAVPVGFVCFGSLLEYLAAALGAEDVVSEAKVFVEEEGAFGDDLLAVFADYFVFSYFM